MHYHCEVIMPKTKDISKSLEEILLPFSEHDEEIDGHSQHSFWDFYVIGGRWAGTKETCTYSPEKIEQFYKQLEEKKVTVSSLQSGKQRLKPESQIPMVDQLWHDLFPTENGEIVPCPLFAHSSNQYDSNDAISCDICRVDEIPEDLTASRVIIAGPSYSGDGLEAHYMTQKDMYNGVNFVVSTWDRKVKSAIDEAVKKFSRYREDWKEKVTPKADWICVTIDYHS